MNDLIQPTSLMKKHATAHASFAEEEDESSKAPKPLPPGRFRTTMGEWGDKLPIGIMDKDGNLCREIVRKPWRTKEDRELGKLIPADADMIDHVSLIVANMCSRIGPHDLDSMRGAHKKYAISSMYMGDVFYVYTLLRMNTIGTELTLPITCPRAGCRSEFSYTGDLNTIEVVGVEELEAMMWRYDLIEPIEIRGQNVTHFQCVYPKWQMMEDLRGNSNAADIRAMTIVASVLGLNDSDDPVKLLLSDLDDLSKPDFEAMLSRIDENFLGPKMGIEGKCEPAVCRRFKSGGYEFNIPINWSYRSFFGVSSR